MIKSVLPNEPELLQQLKSGDEQAFKTLYKAYNFQLYANLLRWVKDEEAAKDLLQDLFIRVWEHRAGIQPDKPFQAYLFVTAKHLMLNYLKHVSVEQQLERFLAADSSELYLHVEEQLYYKEAAELLQQVIAKLPPQRRKAYRLCKEAGKTYEEAALEMNVSKGTVHDHIVNANRFIKEQLLKADITVLAGLFAFWLSR